MTKIEELARKMAREIIESHFNSNRLFPPRLPGQPYTEDLPIGGMERFTFHGSSLERFAEKCILAGKGLRDAETK